MINPYFKAFFKLIDKIHWKLFFENEYSQEYNPQIDIFDLIALMFRFLPTD